MQLQFEDGIGLHRVERLGELRGHKSFQRCRLAALAFGDVDRFSGEVLDQVSARLGPVLAAANDADDVVHTIERYVVPLQNVLALARLHQQVSGAAAHHVDAVIDEMLEGLYQAHLFGLAVDHGQEDHAEALLHRGVLEELVEHDLGFAAALEFDNDAHAVAIALVAHVADVVDDLVVHQFGDSPNQVRLVDLVGNLGDDDGVALLGDVLDCSLSAHQESPTPSAIRLHDAAAAVNVAAGGEVRTLYVLQHVSQGSVWIVYQRDRGVDYFGEIVRRNLGRHPDRDTFRAVDDQVRNAGGHHQRLNRGLVEVHGEVDGVLVDVGQHLLGDLRHAALGVPVRRRWIAIHRTEVALPIHQRITQVPRLGQAHQRVVDRGVAMRVILLQALADHTGALHVLAVVQHAHVVHGVQNAAMHRLQSVADIGQRAPDDDRHRVVEIRTPHLVFDVDGLYVAAGADVVER